MCTSTRTIEQSTSAGIEAGHKLPPPKRTDANEREQGCNPDIAALPRVVAHRRNRRQKRERDQVSERGGGGRCQVVGIQMVLPRHKLTRNISRSWENVKEADG